jgi:peptidoglycan hydrolase-like protein with peptidoglycan-binding domain
VQHRDLSCEELWAQSLARSRARREAVTGTAFPTRGLSVAAAVALTASAAAGITAIEAGAPETAQAVVVKSRGSDVRQLQTAIGVSADGVFGPATQRALKRWQRAHGLTADGIAGPNTRAALGLGSGPVLKRKRSGGRGGRSHARRASSHRHAHGGGGVRSLQRRIGVPADGVFGPGTEAALKRWQSAHGLTPDGVAGPNTRQALGMGSGRVLKRRGSGGGGGGGTLQRVIRAANRIAGLPYQYGGGHRSFRDSGYDCSGSVSYALHGGGLLRSPLDSTGLMSYGAPGRGRYITIYANSGHAYMTINGRRFDTSARSETGSRWANKQRSSAGFVVRHPPGL